MSWTAFWTVIFFLIHLTVVIRALSREHRAPASRLAWVAVIMALPGFGIVAYFLFGDPSANARMDRRLTVLRKELPRRPMGESRDATPPALYRQSFARAASLNGFPITSGNRAELTADSDEAIDWLVADIDGAKDHAHLLFYIWLADSNGTRVAHAMMRAAKRGVAARVIVDGLGSRRFLASALWRDMQAAGVECTVAFDISYPLIAVLYQRLDIRNHRKIVVIDHDVTYVGSQNCADPAFAIKAKYAPWVDIMMRINGPVAWQAQRLFVGDWMAHGGSDISQLLDRAVDMPLIPAPDAFTGVMAGTGSVQTHEGVPDMFQMLLAAAQHEVVITTPYYVPSEALHGQICSAAKRGVRVRINLPAKNDSWVVGMAAKSYFSAFLRAGVEVHEFHGGLLHAKIITVDGQAAMVGSANMDRRSFDLNFENSMMIEGAEVVGELCRLQEGFLARSTRVAREDVAGWTPIRRAVVNAVGTMAPLL